jgi:hypothetical protein
MAANQSNQPICGPMSCPDWGSHFPQTHIASCLRPLGVLIILWVMWANPLPGLAVLCLLVSAALIFLAPLLQLALLKHPRFAGLYGEAAAATDLAIVAIIGILVLAGLFNFA